MTYPAQILDLRNWKLTLPIGASEKPTEIKQPQLATYQHPELFKVDDRGGVRFRAPANGVTTSGSDNPRCELREMNPGGDWSSSSGSHTATVVEAFTRDPNKRTKGTAGTVGLQIHDDRDDVSVFRREGSRIWVTRGDDTHYALALDGYVEGQLVECKFTVWKDVVRAYLNGKLVAAIPGKFSKAYFKAGAYAQAATSTPRDASNFGEVLIYSLRVEHGTAAPSEVEPKPQPQPDPKPQPEPVPAARPKRVLIVLRHGEKPSSKSDHTLNAAGRERAEELADLFTSGRYRDLGLWMPDRLIASKGNTPSMRPLQTLQPLQRDTGLPLQSRYDFETQELEVGRWLAQRLDVTMVCGEHSALVNVCRAFGVITPKLPKAWDSKRFDMFWVFTSDDGKNWKFRQVPQMLMPGDKNAPTK